MEVFYQDPEMMVMNHCCSWFAMCWEQELATGFLRIDFLKTGYISMMMQMVESFYTVHNASPSSPFCKIIKEQTTLFLLLLPEFCSFQSLKLVRFFSLRWSDCGMNFENLSLSHLLRTVHKTPLICTLSSICSWIEGNF